MAILKNIIFDLGGVLLDIDYHKTSSAFADLGVADFKSMYDQFTANELFSNLETGKISETGFYEAMMAHDLSLTNDSITTAWNAMLLSFRLESFAFLKDLATRYRLFLLSNTNSIHKKSFDELFTRATGEKSIDIFFEKAYYSHKVGLRKPNEDIFQFVLQDSNIEAGETLFIDDSINNIEAAASLGIRTHHLLHGERIENLEIFT